MAFDWCEYLNLARVLQTHTGSCLAQEAALRSATSRAYYGAFCRARNHAEAVLGFTRTRTGKDHALVRDCLKAHGLARVARKLATLHQWRKQCDYDDAVPNLSTMVADAITRAQHVLNHL